MVRPPRPWKSQLDRAFRTLALLTGLGHDPGAIQPKKGKWATVF